MGEKKKQLMHCLYCFKIIYILSSVFNKKKKDINLCCGVRSSGRQVSLRNHHWSMNFTKWPFLV